MTFFSLDHVKIKNRPIHSHNSKTICLIDQETFVLGGGGGGGGGASCSICFEQNRVVQLM